MKPEQTGGQFLYVFNADYDPETQLSGRYIVARALRMFNAVANSFKLEYRMSKQVIRTHGEDHLVREDTAKSFRGVYWALASVAAFIVITALLFFGGFLGSLFSGDTNSPASIERQAGR